MKGDRLVPDPSEFSSDEMARQARQHLESLRLAGVEWLPKALAWSPPAASSSPPSAKALVPGLLASAETEPATSVNVKDGDMVRKTCGSTLEQRRQELAVLAEQVSECTRCEELARARKQTVFADGTPGAELCFIGEAPGADEDAQGLPFVGAAGQLLNRIIAACGMKREDVYICNIIKCRPPGNRTPYPFEASNCREYLERQLELAKPKFICALGGTAAQNLLNTTTPLGQLRRKFHDYKGIPVIVTYHPAYLLPHRNPAKKKDVWEDMKMLMERMGRPVK